MPTPHLCGRGDLKCELGLWKKLGAMGRWSGFCDGCSVSGWGQPLRLWRGKWRWVRGCGDEEERPDRAGRKRTAKEDAGFRE